jgi:uncharacterized protein DUF4349
MTMRSAGAWRVILVGAFALALVACTKVPDENFALMVGGSADPGRAQSAGDSARAAQSPADKRLAITHSFTLRLAATEVEPVQQRHLAECAKLGCTVLSTNLDRSIESRISARISMRIAPESYQAFVAVISAPPAEIVMHSESAEDKTAAILDVDKRLEVKTTLRDRLAAMLKDPGAKSAADLAAIEKELAQVQGDIEAIVAQRDYLRTLTDTVRVDITYRGVAAQAGGFDVSPIKQAVDGIGRTLVGSVAALISFLAAAVPWLPVIALVVWGGRRAMRRWRARRA